MATYKTLLTSAIACTAISLWTASSALAQRGGGGGRGGAGAASAGRAGGPGPSGGSGQWRGSPGRGGSGGRDWDDRRRGYGWYGYGLGWDYPDLYYRPWYWDDYARYENLYAWPPAVRVPVIVTAPAIGNPDPNDENPTAVKINVRVQDDAEVWVEGDKTSQTGRLRRFVSPPLSPNGNYTYTVRARWSENGNEVDRTREVKVGAGDEVTLNFFAPGGSVLPPPKPLP